MIKELLESNTVKSAFLKEYYEDSKIIAFDPRDPFGRRLPGWQ